MTHEDRVAFREKIRKARNSEDVSSGIADNGDEDDAKSEEKGKKAAGETVTV